MNLFHAARAGMAAAALAVESAETVNPAMSEEVLRRKMLEIGMADQSE
jgi:hypothetical protein